MNVYKHVYVYYRIFLFVCFLVFLSTVDTHNLGEHGLSNVNPAGDPMLPAITGYFEVELRASFHSDVTEDFLTILEYAAVDESIWFGHIVSPTGTSWVQLFVETSAEVDPSICIVSDSITLDTMYAFKFGVDTDNTARIYKDGIEVATCQNFIKPANVPRTHYLGHGTFEQRFINVRPHDGTISGIRVRNLEEPLNPRTAFELMNFPGQPFGKSFVASFYARFDDLQTRQWQRVFDFGNGAGQDNIMCSQWVTTTDMVCGLLLGGTAYTVVAPGTIVPDEFAFWHFGFDIPGGELWIEKDGTRFAAATHAITTTGALFRSDLLFGQSNFPNDDGLDGVVVGFRLDPSLALSSSSS